MAKVMKTQPKQKKQDVKSVSNPWKVIPDLPAQVLLLHHEEAMNDVTQSWT